MHQVFLLCGFVVIFMAAVTRAAVTKIVNGENADIVDCPWQISLQTYKAGGDWKHVCGGSIIDEKWILTATHCFNNSLTARDYRIAAGSSFLSQTTVYRSVKQIFVHEFFESPLEYDNDIMLLELWTPLSFGSTINKITLDKSKSNIFVGDICKVSGWGRVNVTNGSISHLDRLQQAYLSVVTNENCALSYPGVNFDNSKICLQKKGTDVCFGDSGGPMVCEANDGINRLVGITSFGPDECDGSKPGGYTKVSFFLDWIKNKMNMEKKDCKKNRKHQKNKKNKKNTKYKKNTKNTKN